MYISRHVRYIVFYDHPLLSTTVNSSCIGLTKKTDLLLYWYIYVGPDGDLISDTLLKLFRVRQLFPFNHLINIVWSTSVETRGVAWLSDIPLLLVIDGYLSCVSSAPVASLSMTFYPHCLVRVDSKNVFDHDIYKQSWFLSQDYKWANLMPY